MGVYEYMPTAATLALFLPFPLLRCFYRLDKASYSMVRMLAKPIALACPVQELSKALANRCFWLLSATNAAPPAPYLANSFSLPYLKYASIWTYGMQCNQSLYMHSLQVGHLVTTTHGDINVQASKGILI